jgi:hypothetical protein
MKEAEGGAGKDSLHSEKKATPNRWRETGDGADEKSPNHLISSIIGDNFRNFFVTFNSVVL